MSAVSSRLLLRGGALVAIAGGLLRAAGSFAPAAIATNGIRESLYVTIDVTLAVGLVALYTQLRKLGAWWSTAGFLLAIAGIIVIRTNRFVTSADLYPAGALAIACGIVLLTLDGWRHRLLAGWIPAAFVISTLVGVLATLIPGGSVLFVVSGVMFGLAFAGIGVDLLAAPIAR